MTELLSAPMNPAMAILVAGLIIAALPWHYARKAVMLISPFVALFFWLKMSAFGDYAPLTLDTLGMSLTTFRFDGLSRIWGLIFIIAAFLNALFALHDRDRLQDTMSVLYGGAAMAAVFAGDLITLFIFWEMTAFTSVFLIWRTGTAAARNAGLRYLVMHIGSGVLLLAGAVLLHAQTGSWAFDHIGLEAGLAGWLIFIGFGIKAAFPLLHSWLQDAYPKATITGAVVLSAFTTKMAIYALARGYAGTEILIYIGAIMALFPVFFAVIENDLRRVLSFSINNQLGFMVVGIGIGTSLGINGAAAHAFADVLFKGLLFMSMGAVLYRTGTTKASELGGLFRSMPITAFFCLIGAGSISAFPLMSAFVTKALILAAVADEGHWIIWLILVFASAGVLEHAGIKIPYFSFFAHDSGRRVKEAPWNMLLAMGIAAFLSVFIGVNHRWLYALLPYANDYEPYTLGHIVGQMQLLLAAIFAFALLMRIGWYPSEKRMTILDVDWFWRKPGKALAQWTYAIIARLWAHSKRGLLHTLSRLSSMMSEAFSPEGSFSRVIPTGALAGSAVALLTLALLGVYMAS